MVLLLGGDEAQKDLFHDARLPHGSHPLGNLTLLGIPLLDQADVLGTAGSPLLVKHGMPQEGVSALACDRIFRIAGSHKVSQSITDTLKVISAEISVTRDEELDDLSDRLYISVSTVVRQGTLKLYSGQATHFGSLELLQVC